MLIIKTNNKLYQLNIYIIKLKLILCILIIVIKSCKLLYNIILIKENLIY